MKDRALRRHRSGLLLAMLFVIAAAAFALKAAGANAADNALVAKLKSPAGATVGIVELDGRSGRVNVAVDVRTLKPGFHGFHIHAIGDCTVGDPAKPFTGAGGHFGTPGQVQPNHLGDLPSILVNANGKGSATFDTDRFKLKDVVGRALIVHAGPDNFANIPADRYKAPDQATLDTGDAGARAACGVIKRRN